MWAGLYLYDFSLSMFGPEGLRGRRAADSHKAGWLPVHGRSDQFTASCKDKQARDEITNCKKHTATRFMQTERTHAELQHRLIRILTVAWLTETKDNNVF